LVDLLLAASRREKLDDRVAALELGGLTATVIDVEAYTMESASRLLLGAGDEQRTLAVAELGATTVTLHVLHAGHSVYTREQRFGSLELIEEVQRRYRLDRIEALQQVIEGGLPDSSPPRFCNPSRRRWCNRSAGSSISSILPPPATGWIGSSWPGARPASAVSTGWWRSTSALQPP